jgi:ribonuclease HII
MTAPRRARRRPRRPTAAPHLERLLWRVRIAHVAGVDEVGMGPLAGPVVAAAVVFPPETWVDGVADSKQLTRAERERLDAAIRARALAIGIAACEPDEIDRLNIYHAAMKAKRAALDALRPLVPGFVLVDGREIPHLPIPQSAYPKGDGFVLSIAAASIVAKVHRDAIMRRLDDAYPGYGFGRHMGYATASHLHALREHGPSPIHRRSFAPLASTAQLSLGVDSR